MRSCCIAQGTISRHLGWNMMEDNLIKRTCICVCVCVCVCVYDWVTLIVETDRKM